LKSRNRKEGEEDSYPKSREVKLGQCSTIATTASSVINLHPLQEVKTGKEGDEISMLIRIQRDGEQ